MLVAKRLVLLLNFNLKKMVTIFLSALFKELEFMWRILNFSHSDLKTASLDEKLLLERSANVV